ncbi:MAG: alpha/beta hydrolase, partial [Ginsengibacter sp.]
SGDNAPIANGSEKFPVVVFGHGFLIGSGSYKWLADSLARNGFIVAFPNTEGSVSPNHDAFGKDLSIVCSKIIELNDDASSLFFGRLLRKAAVGGHSMGGGASFLAAASDNPDIYALFNFSAAETSPSAIDAAASVNVPSLVLSGSRDCIVPADTQLKMFNNIPATNCKVYVNVTDALHCQFADNNFTCSAGQLLTGCNSSPLNPAQVFEKTISLLLPFLNYHLKDNCTQGELFLDKYNSITATSKIIQCPPPAPCGPLPVEMLFFTGEYDGIQNVLKWKIGEAIHFKRFELQKSDDAQNFTTIYSITTNNMNVAGREYLSIDAFPFSGSNFYRLKLVDADDSFTYSEVINVRSALRKLIVTRIYPNPIKNVFRLDLTSQSNVEAHIQILEFSGKEIFSKLYTILQRNSSVTIDASSFKPGVLMLLLKSETGEILGSYKLLKL